MEEIWKDIPGYEGYYQVSNLGRVKSVKRYIRRGTGPRGCEIFQRVDGRMLALHDHPNGYKSVMLHIGGKTERILVHRLVADAFVPKEDGKDFINHKDGNKKNNISLNLEWCTKSENSLHASRVLHTMPYHGKAVRCIETNEVFPSASAAALHYGVANTNLINSIHKKNQQRCAGYHWEYINNNQ